MFQYSPVIILWVAHTTLAVQGSYEQCGGQNWSGGVECGAGYTCTYQNPYYSQCLPVKADSNPQAAGAYEQCGGQNWSGKTTCTAGYTCVYQNPYYSQCLPGTSNPTTTKATTTLATTTVATTKSAAPTTTNTSSSAAASSSTAAKVQGPYEQCGGQNWSGGTTCVAGWTCVYSNPYYSQCLQTAGTSSTIATSSTTRPNSSTSTTTTNPVSSSTSTTTRSSSSSSTSTSTPQGTTYKASFTHYGAGDTFGSPNCNTNTAACGFYTYPGYSAAVSENLYGAPPGAGAGPACGTCWRLIGQTDSSGNKLSNAGTTIVVMVNNLCPKNGNPLCAQDGLSGTNQYGANVNFDLCSDSGAQAAFFGNSGVGLALGTAMQVSCSEWSGTVVR